VLGTLATLMLQLYVPLFRDFFHLASPTISLLGLASVTGLLSVLWYEGVKWWVRRHRSHSVRG
jgi:hypothetical protein